MIFWVAVTVFTGLILLVVCSAAMASTEYDRRIDDEKQEEFLKKFAEE